MGSIVSESKRLIIAVDLINAFSPRELYPETELPVTMLDASRRRNINRILHLGDSPSVRTVFIQDAHVSEDFIRMHEPRHAVKGSPQAMRMGWVYTPQHAQTFTKNTYDGTTNSSFVRFLRHENPSEIIVIGTSTGVCVLHTMEGVLRLGFSPVTLIEDACGDMFPRRHAFTIRKLLSGSSIRVLSTVELCESTEN